LTQTIEPYCNSKLYSFLVPCSCGWFAGSSLLPKQFKARNQLQIMTKPQLQSPKLPLNLQTTFVLQIDLTTHQHHQG